MITIPPNKQNSSLVCIYSISCSPSPPIEWSKLYIDSPHLNISHVHPIHLDFDQVNYTRDLGSLLLFSSLESIDFVGCYATRLNDEN